jgi:hypothetical protein
MSGNAAKGMENKLKKLSFGIVMPPLVAYVEGKIEVVQLKTEELEKTRKYAEDLAKTFNDGPQGALRVHILRLVFCRRAFRLNFLRNINSMGKMLFQKKGCPA